MAFIEVRLRGGDGLAFANATRQGALIVSPASFDDTKFQEMSSTGVAFNFYVPATHKQFVITGLLAFANKDVNDASDTIIEVYEASSATSTTADKTLIKFGMGKLTVLPMPALNLLVAEGKFVNAKTDDAIIFMTIMGYFVSA